MFRKADALHPGALDLLSKKGLQIFAQREHDGSPLGVLGVLQQAKADLVTAYCSYGRLVEEKVPGATWMILPPAGRRVTIRYRIATHADTFAG